MANMAITREQLLGFLEAVSRDRPTALLLNSPARFQGGHDEFGRELASRLIEVLAEDGYCWARVPQKNDGLYKLIVEAISYVGGDYRFGLTSEDPSIRTDARWRIAEQILEYLRRTNTAVVRRKRSSSRRG